MCAVIVSHARYSCRAQRDSTRTAGRTLERLDPSRPRKHDESFGVTAGRLVPLADRGSVGG